MTEKEIREGFAKLGIEVNPVAKDYNPTEYGRKLRKTDNGSTRVSYSDRVGPDINNSQTKVVYC